MSTLPPDPYKALGVSKDAQIPEIRSAHRKLVLKCHPDKVQDPELKALKQEEFQAVQQAYELLSDEKERQRYDDQVRLAELRRQMQAKSNTSAPRATPRSAPSYRYEIRTEIRTGEPRSSSYKSTSSGTSPNGKYATYSRSFEEEVNRHARGFEPEIKTVRREPSYDKPSKRESEREREREREREKERERERRKEKEIRRMEKEQKEARKSDKRRSEKERDKERKRESEEKKKHTRPYIEDDATFSKSDKKKSSSKRHEEKRERSSHREEESPYDYLKDRVNVATSYIAASRSKNPAAYASQYAPVPLAPTPPPAQQSAFQVPDDDDDDDARRSSAKPRRGSSGEKGSRKPSYEVLTDPLVADPSPSARHMPTMTSSPPRREHMSRTNTMPADPYDAAYSRSNPAFSRAHTFSGAYPDTSESRGRYRSKMASQLEGSDSEGGEYERKREHERDRGRRSKKNRSPSRTANVTKYSVNNAGRTQYHESYSRRMDPADISAFHDYYSSRDRPAMPPRESDYSQSGSSQFPKYKTSRSYGWDDINFSHYGGSSYDDRVRV